MSTPLLIGGAALLLAPALIAVPLVAVASDAAASVMCMPSANAADQLDGVQVSGADLDVEAQRNAGIVIAVGQQMGIGRRGLIIAIATAMAESGLHSINHGDAAGPDSRGIFQQRDGWGPLAVRLDPPGASRLFFQSLRQVGGYEAMTLADAAWAVQRYDRQYDSHYTQLETFATSLVDSATTTGPAVSPPSAPPATKPKGKQTPGTKPKARAFKLVAFKQNAPGKKAKPKPVTNPTPPPAPTPAPVVAPTDEVVWPVGKGDAGGLHFLGATDMGRATGHPIVAAHAGTVTVSRDIPGGQVGGYASYGRYVVIAWKGANGQYLGNLYAHMQTRVAKEGDTVAAGQLIGYVGANGNTTGPHLHFELFTSGNQPWNGSGGRSADGLDPVEWLQNGKDPELDALPADPGSELSEQQCQDSGGTPMALPDFGGSGPYTDSATIIGTRGTTYTGAQAASRLLKWVGGADPYSNGCLRLTDDAYGPTGGRVGRAIDQWYRAVRANVAHPKDRTPPVGAQLFWWSSNDARHVATYIGGGKVVSNMPGAVKIVNASELDSWGPYLGWAEPYYA